MTDLKSEALDIDRGMHIRYNTKYVSAQNLLYFRGIKIKQLVFQNSIVNQATYQFKIN